LLASVQCLISHCLVRIEDREHVSSSAVKTEAHLHWLILQLMLVCRICLLRQVLMNSKLPVDVLGRIWELSDVDDDGFLDCEEFILVRMCFASLSLAFCVCCIDAASYIVHVMACSDDVMI